MLPVAALNQTGWMVDKKMPRWVNIVSPGSYYNETLVTAELLADGQIIGSFASRDDGYSSLFDRRSLGEGKKDEDYIRDGWLEDLTGAQLDSFTIENRDSADAPLLTQAFFSTSDHAQVAGENIYVNPIFFGRTESNPLKNPQRTFPVDYAYARTLIYTVNLRLPEGYTVQELPKNVALALPGNDAQFRRLCELQGNILQMISQTVIRKVRFQPLEYKALREFYDRIVAAHAEQVVFKRGAVEQAKESAK